jgi:peroxiredoxin Q/BCP
MVRVSDKAPDFTLPGDRGETFSLSECRGSRVLLVFYPGDDTPVCTAQLCEYRDDIAEFADLGVQVVGISGDSLASHARFRRKYELPFVLLSDAGLSVARAWGCKGPLGMRRGVFLVDEKGIVRYAHVEALALFRRRAEELLAVLRDLDGKRRQ